MAAAATAGKANMENKQNKVVQKIEIKRVESKSARQVTFSKRKKGLFNKASEFCALCGAEVAIVIMSPHNKAFTFGYPNTNDVLDRFITGEDYYSSGPSGNQELDRIRQEYKESLNRLVEEEKKHDEIIKKRDMDKANGVFWWGEPIDNMELDELEQYVKSLEKLKKSVTAKIEEFSASEVNFVNQFNIDHQNIEKGLLDFGSDDFDNLGWLFNDMNEGFCRDIDI